MKRLARCVGHETTRLPKKYFLATTPNNSYPVSSFAFSFSCCLKTSQPPDSHLLHQLSLSFPSSPLYHHQKYYYYYLESFPFSLHTHVLFSIREKISLNRKGILPPKKTGSFAILSPCHWLFDTGKSLDFSNPQYLFCEVGSSSICAFHLTSET